jgi:hypothetical protein
LASNFFKDFSRLGCAKYKSYFKKFVDFNVRSIHTKRDAFIPAIQSDINQFVISSINLLIRINQSYTNFLRKVKKIPKTEAAESKYYFALDDTTSFLQPVRVSDNNRQRLIETFKRSRTNAIDLSSPCDVENKYGINYQEVFAILTDLLSGNYPGVEVKSLLRDPIVNVRIK